MNNPLQINQAHYQAGFIDGAASRQTEIDRLEDLADRYYRAAFNDERRILAPALTAIQLEQHRRLQDPPPSITPTDALASWGIDNETPAPEPSAPEPNPAIPAPRRRNTMTTRTITGHLATDPEAVQAGKIRIAKLRVIENTGEYRKGEWVAHEPTTHFIDAKFELADNTLTSLHKGDPVIVIGQEHTITWDKDGHKQHGRVIDADAIGINLARTPATIPPKANS
ncbi:single-stranded DNA-binding protein [Amnibacterium flavum]|uniref:Single-stranded DNA-binding protein n=1 Tax=Amnibacterium flavum TaxID=2173173 RepID=A0A2V1HNV2_9MICO|nr:single-stranded DNA-binding protein [Amnibacterium flavum]PVZ93272.1 hypothetical protein DDQ50_16365 [Amnibacterium flavum]